MSRALTVMVGGCLALLAVSAAAEVAPYEADDTTAALFHMDRALGADGTAAYLKDAAHGLVAANTQAAPLRGVEGPAGLGRAAGPFTAESDNGAKGVVTPEQLKPFSHERFTIEAWVRLNAEKPTATDKAGIFQVRDQLTGNRFEFAIKPASDGSYGPLLLAFQDTGKRYRTVTSDPLQWTPGAWYHVAVTYDNNTPAEDDSVVRFYRTPFSDTSGSATAAGEATGVRDLHPYTSEENQARLNIGSLDQHEQRYLGGAIDEVRYYNDVVDRFNLNKAP